MIFRRFFVSEGELSNSLPVPSQTRSNNCTVGTRDDHGSSIGQDSAVILTYSYPWQRQMRAIACGGP